MGNNLIDLTETETAIDFYDKRYQDGYMEEWDEIKKNKVKEVISLLGLPATGKALDFGCGNGVFTNIIKQVLPGWEVYGVEISPTAVKNAGRKFPDCHFFGIDTAANHLGSFDFLFSHHVIEHIQETSETFRIINDYLKPKASQLHILPCGNKDSYEYNISKLQQNGIETDKGNRFFFEEPGHLRRLNTEEFSLLEKAIGFSLRQDYYSNQYHGAINWITKSSPRFVKKLTNPQTAVSDEARKTLKKIRRKLLPLTWVQFPYSKYWMIKSKWHKKSADYIKLMILFLPAMLSRPFYAVTEQKSAAEWSGQKKEPNGSEMFLYYERA
jgi:trans-aconitate methyltransferase